MADVAVYIIHEVSRAIPLSFLPPSSVRPSVLQKYSTSPLKQAQRDYSPSQQGLRPAPRRHYQPEAVVVAARNRHTAAAAADPVQDSPATGDDTRRPSRVACYRSPEHRPEVTPDHHTCCSAAAHSPCSGTTDWGTRRCCSGCSPATRVRVRHRRR